REAGSGGAGGVAQRLLRGVYRAERFDEALVAFEASPSDPLQAPRGTLPGDDGRAAPGRLDGGARMIRRIVAVALLGFGCAHQARPGRVERTPDGLVVRLAQ